MGSARARAALDQTTHEKRGGFVHIGSGIHDRRRIRLLISLFVLVLVVIYASIWGLYRMALGDAREHLIRIAQTQARSAEAIGLEIVAASMKDHFEAIDIIDMRFENDLMKYLD